jgi:hypothetical protein
LEALHLAYVGLEVLAGEADLDSHHVANAMAPVNFSFQDALGDLRKFILASDSLALRKAP